MDASVWVGLVGPEDAGHFRMVAPGVFDEPVDPERLKACLAAPGHLLALAVSDGVVVGQAAGMIHRHPDKPTEFYLDEVGVGDAFLRRGIASRLVEALLAEARAQGCAEAWVGTESDNVAAHALYRRFDPVEVSPFTLFLYRL